MTAQHQEQVGIALQRVIDGCTLSGEVLLPFSRLCVTTIARGSGWPARTPFAHTRTGSMVEVMVVSYSMKMHDEIHAAGGERGVGVVVVARAVATAVGGLRGKAGCRSRY